MKEKLSLRLEVPGGERRVLLHSCCAPCSSAIVECMLSNGLTPTLYFFNPNIYPAEEYMRRKQEAMRFARSQGVDFVDADYDHERWLSDVRGLEGEPERGRRCLQCFRIRLTMAARYAHEQGFRVFTTTLASSRWKDIRQIAEAGREAASAYDDLTFWEQNWRRGGLQDRRRELLRQYGFYNQQYCGCEFSVRTNDDSTSEPLVTT